MEPVPDGKTGILIQNLGKPTQVTEELILLTTYAADSQKDLRSPPLPPDVLIPETTNHINLDGITFAIDPPGCRDVDDTVTFKRTAFGYIVGINIADVAAWIPSGSSLDRAALARATSFYSTEGVALAPMFHRIFSEGRASLLADGNARPTLSLVCEWTPGRAPANFQFAETMTIVYQSYTYDSATQAVKEGDRDLALLQGFVADLTGSPPTTDSHVWIEALMRLYNTEAGKALKAAGTGILRRGAGPNVQRSAALESLLTGFPDLQRTLFHSAEFCSATDPESTHLALGIQAYAYASSPLRRYVDLFNQRILKAVIAQGTLLETPQHLIDELNRREKQAKAFQRDLFFFQHLARPQELEPVAVMGIALLYNAAKLRLEVWVPAWNRSVKVRLPLATSPPTPGKPLSLRWYCDPAQISWKSKIVFQIP